MSVDVSLQEWLDKRAKLNHDLLINRIRNVLGALARDASGCDAELSLLRTWISRQDEYREFIRSAMDVLSAARVFGESSPASIVCQEHLSAWQELSHRFFLAETGIEGKITNLEKRLQESIDLANQLLSEESAEGRKKVAGALFASTERLSAGISALPSNFVTKSGPMS